MLGLASFGGEEMLETVISAEETRPASSREETRGAACCGGIDDGAGAGSSAGPAM